MDATSIQPNQAQAQIKVDSPLKKAEKAPEVSERAIEEANPEGVGEKVDLKI